MSSSNAATTPEPIVLRVLDWTAVPGARYRWNGPFSGEEYREEVLRPAFVRAQQAGLPLVVDFDGTEGYPTSFLEEAFGGLVREFGLAAVDGGLMFKCNDEPSLDAEVRGYLERATNTTK